jgi:hypothetical protein
VTFKDNYIKDKCENRKPQSLQELVFVSSNDGKIIYKNKFCALCHDENNAIIWEISAFKINMCRQLISEEHLSAISVTEFILHNCAVSFKRPKSSTVDHQGVICFDNNIISKCNETGKWDVYDSKIERMCLNPPGKRMNIFHYLEGF